MKRKLFIVSCWLMFCALFFFEYVLVVISIWQHAFGNAMCMTEGEKSLCQILGLLIVFVRFSSFRLLKWVGFCFPRERDVDIASRKNIHSVELSYALYGVLLNLINPLSVVCVVGIFDVSHMHYFWMLTPFWACGVVLLGMKRRTAGLQLMIIRPRTRPKVLRQIILVCDFCRRCTMRDYFIVAFVLALSLFIGYSVSKFTEERSQNIEGNSGVVECGSNLMVDGDTKSRGERSCVECGFVGKSSLVNKVVNSTQNLSGVSESLVRSATDAFAMRHDPSIEDAAQYASDLSDVMDEMLNRGEIPTDYAETMVALFRDKLRGDVVRDFAVQHIGLYAETLKMRGKYDSDSTESAALREALWDASDETRTIVAVAAFRALADMAAFDPRVDASRLDNRLASCVADGAASPAARVMAAQLCGERRVASARAALAAIAADRAQPEPLRLAAANSAKLLAK